MAVTYAITYEERVVSEDIPDLPQTWRTKIKKAIEDKLAREPEVFGKPLRRSLKHYRKMRVGDYRVIFRIHRSEVRIFYIGHRSCAYECAERRT